MNKVAKGILIFILSGVFVYCGVRLIGVLREYKQGNDIYAAEREQVFLLRSDPTPVPSAVSLPEQTAEPVPTEYFPDVEVDFSALTAESPDIVGWLWIPDTDINYPLVRGADNDRYLYTTYNGIRNSAGSIFMDYRNAAALTDANTVIYGHNMKNGSMFGKLKQYAEQEFFDEHRVFYIFTPSATYKYTCFSAYVTDTGSRSYSLAFDTSALPDYIDFACASSQVRADLVPAADDRLVMLSTCTSRVQNERFVVHAVLTAVQEN